VTSKTLGLLCQSTTLLPELKEDVTVPPYSTQTPADDASILFLHLSDVHIKSERDSVLTRVDQLAAAAQWGIQSKHCVILFTGDVAQAGEMDQYSAAAQWLSSLRAVLRERFPGLRTLETIIVPGNHDLSHVGDNNIRTMLLDQLQRGCEPPADVLRACLEPQDQFFAHLPVLEERSEGPEPCLWWTRRICIESVNIHVMCLNTAWMSRKHEKQGTLDFPPSSLPSKSDADLTIALLHHPWNWFEATSARALRNALLPVADLILTGHEHDGDVVRQAKKDASNLLIAGEALQMHGDGGSAFVLLQIRPIQKTFRWRRMKWTGHRYEPIEDSRDNEPLPVFHQRNTSAAQISDEWERELSDLGVLLESSAGAIGLDDLYVEPYVRRQDPLVRTTYASEPASNILEMDPGSLTVLSGEERSGRTSLAKFLFRKAARSGRAPVFLFSRDLLDTKGPLESIVATAFCRQYRRESSETYVQLDRSRRLIVCDEFDAIPSARQRDLLRYASEIGASIVLLVRDAFAWDFARKLAGVAVSSWFRILPFKRSQRELLVRNWQLHDRRDVDCASEVKWRDQVLRTFDTLIGRSFLPSSPFYMLSVLASFGAPQTSVRESTHGYFYEMLIKTHLIKGLSAPQFNIVLTYLAELAWGMFQQSRDWVIDSEWQRFHSDYVERFDVSRDFSDMKSFFLSRSIMCARSDEFRFRYPYMYYYFVALYMRDHLDDDGVRESVANASQEIYRSKNANVLVFLAHLSRDKVVIDSIMESAAGTFRGVEPAKLEEDSKFVRELGLEFSPITVSEPDAATSRLRRLELSDEQDDELLPAQEHVVELDEIVDDELLEIRQSLHAVDILGQILKNFPGSIDAERKLEVARSAYETAMRLLTAFLTSVRYHRANVTQRFVAELRTRHPSWTEERLSHEADRTLAVLSELSTYAVIRRLASALGSVELVRTYDKMLAADGSNAMLMLRVALDLEQQHIFPERTISELHKRLQKNPLPLWVLRDFVLDHFHMFPVERAVRQRACALLGITWAHAQIESGDLAVAPASGDASRAKAKRRRRSKRRGRK
jgi:hypothetical protein